MAWGAAVCFIGGIPEACFAADFVSPGMISTTSARPGQAKGEATARTGGGSGASATASPAAEAARLRSAALALVQRGDRNSLRLALRFLLESARRFQRGRQDSEAAEGYLVAGEVYELLSHYRQALRAYQQGLHLIQESDPALKCSLLSHIAKTYPTLGDIKQSLQYSGRALELSRRIGNEAAEGEALEAQGEGLLWSKETKQAYADLDHAIQIFHRYGNKTGEARALLNQGYASLELGLTSEAFQHTNQALQLWRSVNSSHDAAQAHVFLALLYVYQGEPQRAINEYAEADRVFHVSGDLDHEAITLNGQGLLSNEMGDYDASLRFFRKARTIFAQSGDLPGEIGAIDGMAKAEWALRHYRNAVALYKKQLQLATRAGNNRFEASALSQLGKAARHENHSEQARKLYLKALTLYKSADHVPGEVAVLIQLGNLRADAGDNEQAQHYFTEAFELERQAEQLSSMAKIHYGFGLVDRSLNNLEGARKEAEEAVKIIEAERTKVADFETRASYFASVHDYYRLYIDVLMQLHNAHPTQGFETSAFEASEKSKMRSLLDRLLGDPKSECRPDEEDRVRSAGDVGNEQTQDASECLMAAPSALTLGEIQDHIKNDDAVLLEYTLDKERSYAWVLDGTRVTSVLLPGEEKITRLAKKFHAALTARQPLPGEQAEDYVWRVRQADRQYQNYSRELSQILLEPVASFLTRKRLVVVPDGFLRYIPFTALPLPESAGTPGGEFEISYLPSASILKPLRADLRRHPAATELAAIFADPVFDSRDPRLVSHKHLTGGPNSQTAALAHALRDVELGSKGISRLPASRTEASAIAEALSAPDIFMALDFKASRDAVISTDLGRYRYIHFATHGILDAKNPELSGLILSMVKADGKPVDGYLRLKDIYQLKLAADMVVLSSCNSALGRDMNSEGIIGLTRAFLYAGSKRVVSSLWKVDDTATAELMKRFYRRLRSGDTPAAALRRAQSELSRVPGWESPFYWAAFILQGEYK